MPRPEKVQMVSQLRERMEASSAMLLSDYAGLTVEQMNKLRRNLRENQVTFLIAKNTLLKLAAESIGGEYGNLAEHWKGPTAVAFSAGDPTVPARLLYEFAKDNEQPVFKAGLVDGVVYDKTELERLAKLPARDVLLGNVVGAISSPLAALIGTIDGVMREFVGTVDAIARAKA
jgi:large subunit ribosomal protein L10